jgi:asparagine synthase (glutamine-hydrolysing)
VCGITGFWWPHTADADLAELMATQIESRGPDDFGTWCSDLTGLTLAHRRLSIIDLSPAGHQPMLSQCGRYTLVFNGEIYNHIDLRCELEKASFKFAWRGHSDTETLLAGISVWGVQGTLRRLNGMFAFALWDSVEKALFLARDRMGEKPLYWGWCGDVLLFGSELKALKVHPEFNAEIDRNALTLLLRHCYIPAPYSIYQGIQKLMPGHLVQIPLHGDLARSKDSQPEAYWQLNHAVEKGLANPFTGSPDAAVDLLASQLSASIGEQMLSDVPLGAFLSGGVDSSTIVALMQAQSEQPIRTFTIGFDQDGYNEATHAKAVAEHLGTHHTELYVRPEDALAVIPKLPEIYCEPFSDSSQIPTFLVSQMAKEHVTVALTGDGGDELFGGYNRYMAARKVWGPVNRLPMFARHAAAGILRSLSPTKWDKLFDWARPVLPTRFQFSIPGEKARKLADVLALSDSHAFYRQLTSHWTDPAHVVIGATEPKTLLTTSSAWPETDCLEHAMMAMDAQTYMADDILTKVDRAAMATSLETRVPMLDHRVVELAWRMPMDFKIRGGQGKWLLRQVLYKHVPRELIERPKMGFGIPLDSWLRGPLREWAEALLDESRLRSEGFFHPEPIRAIWAEHLSGKQNWQYHLWSVLMFQAWLEVN